MNNEKALEEAIADLESNVCGCGSISDYSDNSLDTVLKAARAHLTALQSPLPDLAGLKSNLDASKTGEIYEHAKTWNAAIDACIAALADKGAR